jgi:Family of unknown function (DUF5684)
MLFLQQSDSAPSAASVGLGIGFTIFWLAIVVLLIASMWKIFVKAGEPGWAAIVPIYNLIVLFKIAGKPAWWVLLMLIPLVNLIVAIIAVLEVARRFGKGVGFGIGMIVLSPIFYPMLAWGDARYQP